MNNLEDKYLDIITDTSEVVLDSFLDYTNQALEELPLVKIVKGAIDFKSSLEEHFFIKKIATFLFTLNDIDKDKRIEMMNKINSNNQYRHRVGEKLFEILNRVDSDVKPEILGNLFKSYIQEKITYNKFLKLAFVVEKSHNQDLILLKDSSKDGKINILEDFEIADDNLVTEGIGSWGNTKDDYNGHLTSTGRDIAKYGWLMELDEKNN